MKTPSKERNPNNLIFRTILEVQGLLIHQFGGEKKILNNNTERARPAETPQDFSGIQKKPIGLLSFSQQFLYSWYSIFRILSK